MTRPLFDPAAFDLPAYLARVGHAGPVAPDDATLRALAWRHPAAIPFENLGALLGEPLALDSAALQAKLVHGRRGGWCFEHNMLLGTALTAIGFEVEGLAARVLWNLPANAVRPRSHMVLLVHVAGEPCLVDAGFGGLTLTAPVRLVAGVAQATPHEACRLRETGGHYVLEADVRGEWRPLYRFDLQRQARVDYEMASWYLAHHPASPFLASLIAARAVPGRRYALLNGTLAVHDRDGTTTRVLPDGPALRAVLEDTFGLRLGTSGACAAVLARHASSTMAGV